MSGKDEVTMAIPYYADNVGLNTDDIKRPINMLDDLLKYLVTVKKRWGNTAVTCNIQWGASALWIRSEQAEKIAALESQLTAAAKRVEELEGQLAALKAGYKQIQERFDEARDNILHCRGGLAEELDGRPEVVNAILGIIDDLGEVITTTNGEGER